LPILKDLLKISRLSNNDTTTLDINECIQTEANSSSEASSNLSRSALESLTDSFLEKIDPLDYKYIKEILIFFNHT
jgi:hypothetical protein